MAQNRGAGKQERCRRSYELCLLYATCVGLILGISLYLLRVPFLSLFTNDAEVVTAGTTRLAIMALSYGLSPADGLHPGGIPRTGADRYSDHPGYIGFGSIPALRGFLPFLHTSTQSSRCTCCTPFHGESPVFRSLFTLFIFTGMGQLSRKYNFQDVLKNV
ncbi:MAG: MATE family efflux transporter [Clostridium fessum]